MKNKYHMTHHVCDITYIIDNIINIDNSEYIIFKMQEKNYIKKSLLLFIFLISL